GRDAHLAARADDTDGDLAAIGDEQAFEHECPAESLAAAWARHLTRGLPGHGPITDPRKPVAANVCSHYVGLTGMAPPSTAQRLASLPSVVIDPETPGGSALFARVLEVAAIRVQNGVVQDRLECLVDPGMPIPPFVTRITGINANLVRGKPA